MKPSKLDAVSMQQAKASLAAMLIMTRNIDRLDIDSLTRSYRAPRGLIKQMLAAERKRRGCA